MIRDDYENKNTENGKTIDELEDFVELNEAEEDDIEGGASVGVDYLYGTVEKNRNSFYVKIPNMVCPYGVSYVTPSGVANTSYSGYGQMGVHLKPSAKRPVQVTYRFGYINTKKQKVQQAIVVKFK